MRLGEITQSAPSATPAPEVYREEWDAAAAAAQYALEEQQRERYFRAALLGALALAVFAPGAWKLTAAPVVFYAVIVRERSII